MKNPEHVYYTVTHSENEEEPAGLKRILDRAKKDISAFALIVFGALLVSMLLITQMFCSMTCAGCHRNTLLRKGKTISGKSAKAWFCDDCADRMIRHMLKETEN